MKIIIFGTGSTAEIALKKINKEIDILAVSDNNEEKWDKLWNNYKVISPSEINKYDYDYILICSMFTNEIIESLMEKGVRRHKIIPYFNNCDLEEQIAREDRLRKMIFKQNNNKKVALLTRRNSGCNCLALYKRVPEYIKNNFFLELIDLEEYKQRWQDFEVAFTTHMESRNFKNRINIETWHGFPIKSLGLLEKNCIDNISRANSGIDYVLSYSNLYSFIMSSVYNIDIRKFITTGMPRNDLLQNPKSKALISQLIGRDVENKKLIFYVPTFRNRMVKKIREGIEVLSQDNDLINIDSYMNSIEGYFIVKKHPVEGDEIKNTNYKNIFFLEDEDFKTLNIDFYEILGGSDILITDYSSVYFDYLLLDKPIIFWTKDLEIYEERRGFLFDNVDKWMPGPKVKTVFELIDAIDKFINNYNWYSSERNNIKNLAHTYQDFNSTNRVWDLLLNIYN